VGFHPGGMRASPDAASVAFGLRGDASHGAVQVRMMNALTDAGITAGLRVRAPPGALRAVANAATPTPAGVKCLADAR